MRFVKDIRLIVYLLAEKRELGLKGATSTEIFRELGIRFDNVKEILGLLEFLGVVEKKKLAGEHYYRYHLTSILYGKVRKFREKGISLHKLSKEAESDIEESFEDSELLKNYNEDLNIRTASE